MTGGLSGSTTVVVANMPGLRIFSGLAIVAWTRMLRVSVAICGSMVVILPSNLRPG